MVHSRIADFCLSEYFLIQFCPTSILRVHPSNSKVLKQTGGILTFRDPHHTTAFYLFNFCVEVKKLFNLKNKNIYLVPMCVLMIQHVSGGYRTAWSL